MQMNCPVCPTQNIPNDATACPNCKTDLTPILRVKELADAEYNEALGLLENGAVDEAMRHAAAALSMNGDSVSARKLMGKLLVDSGQFSGARSQLQQAKRLAPADPEIASLLSEANHAAMRKKLQVVVMAVAFLIFIAATFLLAYRLIRSSDRLNAIAAKFDTLELYRGTHRYSDSDFRQLQSDLEKSKAAQAESQQRLEDYRTVHRVSDKEYKSITDTLPPLSNQIARLRGDLTNLVTEYISLRAALGQQQDRYMQLARQQTEDLIRHQASLTDQVAATLTTNALFRNAYQSSEGPHVAAKTGGDSRSPVIEISVPGIIVTTQASSLVLCFETGLFSRGTLFRPGARETLATLGRRLESHAEHIFLEIEGFTDEKPLFVDAVSLARKRASAVADFLCGSCGLSAQQMAIRGMGLKNLPYPNDSLEQQVKNRTVVIRIWGRNSSSDENSFRIHTERAHKLENPSEQDRQNAR